MPRPANGRGKMNGHAAAAATPGGAEDLPPADGRIIVTLPDGTVLTLIGATRLVLAIPGSTAAGATPSA